MSNSGEIPNPYLPPQGNEYSSYSQGQSIDGELRNVVPEFGDYVVLAGQVGVRDHIHIGSRTMVGAQAGVVADTGEDKVLLGSPAMPSSSAI